MNSKYCELNRPHSTDCRICDIFISLIYSYYHKKKNSPWKGGVRCLVGYLWVFWLFFFLVMLGTEAGWACYCLKKKISFAH